MTVCLSCGTSIEPETARAAADGFYCIPHCPTGLIGTYGPFEHHRMPNPGYECYYRDDFHSYWKVVTKRRVFDKKAGAYGPEGYGGSGRIPGISTISGYVDACSSTGGLVHWAVRETKAGRNTDEASTLGTHAHNFFESMLTEKSGMVVDGTEGFANAIEGFLETFDLTPLQTECVVYSKDHGFAGRFDARVSAGLGSGRPGVEFESETWLLDLKSVKELGKAWKPKYNAQLAGYELAAKECGYGPSDRRVILEVTRDGLWQLYDAQADDEDFLGCLNGYADAKGLNSRLKDLMVPMERMSA